MIPVSFSHSYYTHKHTFLILTAVLITLLWVESQWLSMPILMYADYCLAGTLALFAGYRDNKLFEKYHYVFVAPALILLSIACGMYWWVPLLAAAVTAGTLLLFNQTWWILALEVVFFAVSQYYIL